MILGYAEIQEAYVPEDIVVKLPAVKVEGKLSPTAILSTPIIRISRSDPTTNRRRH